MRDPNRGDLEGVAIILAVPELYLWRLAGHRTCTDEAFASIRDLDMCICTYISIGDYVIHTGVLPSMIRKHSDILTMGILKSSWV